MVRRGRRRRRRSSLARSADCRAFYLALPPNSSNEQKKFPSKKQQGKLDTETYLAKSGVAWTSIRPVYIYGPLNYNPVEEWFFHRLAAGRPVPVPGSGKQVRRGFFGGAFSVAFLFSRRCFFFESSFSPPSAFFSWPCARVRQERRHTHPPLTRSHAKRRHTNPPKKPNKKNPSDKSQKKKNR